MVRTAIASEGTRVGEVCDELAGTKAGPATVQTQAAEARERAEQLRVDLTAARRAAEAKDGRSERLSADRRADVRNRQADSVY